MTKPHTQAILFVMPARNIMFDARRQFVCVQDSMIQLSILLALRITVQSNPNLETRTLRGV